MVWATAKSPLQANPGEMQSLDPNINRSAAPHTAIQNLSYPLQDGYSREVFNNAQALHRMLELEQSKTGKDRFTKQNIASNITCLAKQRNIIYSPTKGWVTSSQKTGKLH